VNKSYVLAEMCTVWGILWYTSTLDSETHCSIMPQVLEISSTLSAYERSNKNESKDKRRRMAHRVYYFVLCKLFFVPVNNRLLSMGQIMTECAMCGSRAILTNAEGRSRCVHCNPV